MSVCFFTSASHLAARNSLWPTRAMIQVVPCSLRNFFWQPFGLRKTNLWFFCLPVNDEKGQSRSMDSNSKIFKARFKAWVEIWACLKLPWKPNNLSAQEGSLLLCGGWARACWHLCCLSMGSSLCRDPPNPLGLLEATGMGWVSMSAEVSTHFPAHPKGHWTYWRLAQTVAFPQVRGVYIINFTFLAS